MRSSVFLFISLFILFISCQEKQQPTNESHSPEQIIDDEKLLIGKVDRKDFQLPEYKTWFDSSYQAYEPKIFVLDAILPYLDDLEVKIFMGTWCSDSQRDVPALYKIFEYLTPYSESLNIIAIDRSKTLPKVDLEGYTIDLVPTTIIYRKNQELGRIIETPNKSLEEDIMEMVRY